MPNVYVHDDQESAKPQCMFMEELSSDDYVPNEQVPYNNHNNPQVWMNVANLDNFFESNQQCELASLLPKWGVIYKLKSLWDFKSEK